LILLHFRISDVLIVPVMLAVLWGAADMMRSRKSGSWLSHDWAVWLGEISYGIYLFHASVAIVIFYGGYQLLGLEHYTALLPFLMAGFAAAILALAALMHHTVERPMRKLIWESYVRQKSNPKQR